MGTKYTSQSASGYNATPPTDDGTQSDANKVKWSTIKGKLTDPAKTLADNINSQVNTALDYGPVSVDSAAVTLGTSHNNQFIELSGAATPTLDSSDGLGAGWFCDVKNVGTQAITMARERTNDTIDGVTADVTLNPTDYIRFVVNAAATGFYTLARQPIATQAEVNSLSDGYRIVTPSTLGAFIGRGALVTLADSVSVSDSTNTVVTWDTEEYDTDSIHSAGGDSRLNVPSGITKVILKAQIKFAANTTGIRAVSFRKNGSEAATYVGGANTQISPSSAFQTIINITSPVLTVVGGTDYFEVRVYQSSGGRLDIESNESWFSMELIK